MYLPSLRVLVLNTQSSLAPIISSGRTLASLNLSSVLRYFNLATSLSALFGLALRGARVAFALSITKSSAVSNSWIAVV